MIAPSDTGIPMDQIDAVWGDTDLVAAGADDGVLLHRSSRRHRSPRHRGEALVESARQIAAGCSEADVMDVVLDTDRGKCSMWPVRQR